MWKEFDGRVLLISTQSVGAETLVRPPDWDRLTVCLDARRPFDRHVSVSAAPRATAAGTRAHLLEPRAPLNHARAPSAMLARLAICFFVPSRPNRILCPSASSI